MTGARRVRHAPARADKVNAAVGTRMSADRPNEPARLGVMVFPLIPAGVAFGLLVYAIGWMP